ncbi:MAG: ABC transporter ATP-binding protein [Elusimicrobiota bacterium]|jgi:iron(III) transport system ATP-binding protein|nr:ABC transporter ATP-binding protein [Elusimicrobiota bacterium]
MSVKISFKNIVKRYGNNTVIPDLSLEVNEGEFFTLLGPSGCGKTTLLRMVAGFNSIEGGEIYFNDKLINNLAPGSRNIGMVFQNYAIFPHMNVTKNVAFGLTNRHMEKSKIAQKVKNILEIVQIEEYKNRMPENLSGGQQQRVALARAIVIEPDVLLMDEPLSNLDAKLRVDMRNAIKSIQREFGITTIYVTHDQEEAMAVSDRLAIMNKGIIEQIGQPQITYQKPANLFVATFIGRTNILDAKLSGDLVSFDNYSINANCPPNANSQTSEKNVKVSVRPEEFFISQDKSDGIKGIIKHSVFLGLNTHYFIELKNKQQVEVIERSTQRAVYAPGTEVLLKIDAPRINIFTADGRKNLSLGGSK